MNAGGADLAAVLLEHAARSAGNPGLAIVPSGRLAGMRLADVADAEGGHEWIGWAIGRPAGTWPGSFEDALWRLVRARFPELIDDSRRAA